MGSGHRGSMIIFKPRPIALQYRASLPILLEIIRASDNGHRTDHREA